MKKGSIVYYKAVNGTVYGAIVKRVHRDDSLTAGVFCAVPNDGECFYGFEYREYAVRFYETPEMAARS